MELIILISIIVVVLKKHRERQDKKLYESSTLLSTAKKMVTCDAAGAVARAFETGVLGDVCLHTDFMFVTTATPFCIAPNASCRSASTDRFG